MNACTSGGLVRLEWAPSVNIASLIRPSELWPAALTATSRNLHDGGQYKHLSLSLSLSLDIYLNIYLSIYLSISIYLHILWPAALTATRRNLKDRVNIYVDSYMHI